MLKTKAGDIIGGGGAHTSTGTRLLRRKEVEATTGLSKSHIYDLMKRGLFPLPVPLSTKAVAWVSSEVQAWCADRIAQRDRAVA